MTLAYDDLGSGFPVVLLHAFPLSRKMWQPNVEAIANAGFRVLLPDLTGFGENKLETSKISVEQMARDVASFLDKLAIEKAIIGGLSMGGYVTVNLYRLFPGKFAGLILCDTNASADAPEFREKRYNLINQIESRGAEALVEIMLPNLISERTKENQDLVNELKSGFRKCDPESAIAALKAMAARLDHTALLAKIDCPTLLVFGEEDKITNLEAAKSMAQQIRNSELKAIPEAGHYSNLENPDDFNTAIVRFLRKLPDLP